MKISTYDRRKKKGVATFLYFRWNNVKHQPLLGYDLTQPEKSDLAIKMVERIKNPPVAHNPKPKADLTLIDFAHVYYDRLRSRKRVDIKRPKGIIDNHLSKYFTGPLVAIQPEDCDDYVIHRQKQVASDGTIKREIGVLQRILKIALRRRVISFNPCAGIELAPGDKRERVATTEELSRLWHHANVDMRRAIVIALATGLREGKILAIDATWIHRARDGKWINLPDAESLLKGTPKKTPLNRAATAQLSGIPILRGRIFARWKERSFKKAWSVLCVKAKVNGLHFHDLRHTFTTWLREEGIEYETRSALLGHKLPGKTADYTHEGPKWDAELRRSVNALDSRLDEMMSAGGHAIAATL